MSLLENVTESFGASFQDNHFHVNKLGQYTDNKRIAATQKGRQETNCADRGEIGCYSCYTWNITKEIS
jgi:hypothetical protein